MKDRISALVDGELDETEASGLVAQLREQPELRRCWNDYQLVGDALRGHLSCDVSSRLSERLSAEPTVLAPQRMARRHDRLKAAVWPALSAAAGAAAVAVVAWVVFPASAPLEVPGAVAVSVPASAPVASPSMGATLVAAPHGGVQPASDSSSTLPAGVVAAPSSQDSLAAVTDYLVAHQRFSPTNAMHGVAPYVRTVAHEGDSR